MTESHSLCIHLMTNPQHQPMCAINDSGRDEFCCVDCAATKLGRLVDSVSVATVARMCSFSKCPHEQAVQRGDEIDYSGFCFRCLLGTLGYLSTVTSFALFGEDRRIGLRLLKLIRLLAKRNGKSADPLFNWTYDI
jgi:hypothetical protein